MKTALLLAAAALTTSACGGASGPCTAVGPFAPSALTTVSSAGGALQLEVRTAPQPPVRGINSAQLTVTDAHGAPATGLTLSVTPWMPDMGHGASVQPTVQDVGGGVYTLGCLDLVMPGTWQLRATFSGTVNDSATATLQVP